MKTLSQNVATGKDLPGSQPVYLVKVCLTDSTILRWAYPITVNDGGVIWDGSIIAQDGIGDIELGIDLEEGGNISSISDLTLRLNNSSLLSDVYLGYPFTGSSLELRLGFYDVPGFSYNNAVCLYLGVIENIEVDQAHITLRCVDAWAKRHRMILLDTLSKDEYESLPEDNYGKPIPIIYGDFEPSPVHKTGIAGIAGGLGWGLRDYAKGYVVKRSNPTDFPGIGEAVVCKHDIYHWHTAEGRYFNTYSEQFQCWGHSLYDTRSYSYSNGVYKRTGCYFFNPNINDLFVDLVPDSCTDSSGALYPERAIDEDPNNYMELRNGGDYAVFEFLRRGAYQGRLIPTVVASFDRSGIIDDLLKFTISKPGERDIVGYITDFYGLDHRQAFCGLYSFDFSASDYETVSIKFEYEVVGSEDPNGVFRIANLFMRTPEITGNGKINEVYFALKGRKYSWTRYPHSAGDLIEHPVAVVESLLRDELSIDPSYIDVGSFDQVESERINWRFARELLEPEYSSEIIRSIACEGVFGYVQSGDGRERCVSMDPSAQPYLIDESKIVMSNPPISDISLKMITLSKIKNNFVMKYKKNLYTGNYEKELYVKNPDAQTYQPEYTNLSTQGELYWEYCHRVFQNLGLNNSMVIEADWIRNDDTAEKFLKKLILWLTFSGDRRAIAKLTTSLSTLDLEIGDQTFITHPLLPGGWETLNWICTDQRISPIKGKIEYSFLLLGG